jgi:glycosyltransferase involved in cell wall biosynthesis
MVVAMMRDRDKLPSYRQLGQALSAVRAGDWTVVVVGDGPARPQVEAALAPLGDAVRFLGAVEPSRLPAVLAAADLYVWPAVGEAYGMAFLEAQAAGLPVIASRISGSVGLLGEDYAGYYPPEDEAALAGLLSKAESDLEFYALLDRQCGARADLFRPEREREAWREMLAGLARGGDID